MNLVMPGHCSGENFMDVFDLIGIHFGNLFDGQVPDRKTLVYRTEKRSCFEAQQTLAVPSKAKE